MLFTFIIGQCFTTMLCSMRYGVFLFFAGVQSMFTASTWELPSLVYAMIIGQATAIF